MNYKYILYCFLALLLIIGVIFFILNKKPLPDLQFLPQSQASFSLTCDQKKLRSDQEIKIQVIMDTDGREVSSAGIILSFNKNDFGVVKVMPGNIFSLYLDPKIDNQKGEVKISGLSFNKETGKPDKPFLGKAEFASIILKTKPIIYSKSSEVKIEFIKKGSTIDSNIMDAKTAKDILERVDNLKFILTP